VRYRNFGDMLVTDDSLGAQRLRPVRLDSQENIEKRDDLGWAHRMRPYGGSGFGGITIVPNLYL
jgi:hypothetical protein